MSQNGPKTTSLMTSLTKNPQHCYNANYMAHSQITSGNSAGK